VFGGVSESVSESGSVFGGVSESVSESESVMGGEPKVRFSANLSRTHGAEHDIAPADRPPVRVREPVSFGDNRHLLRKAGWAVLLVLVLSSVDAAAGQAAAQQTDTRSSSEPGQRPRVGLVLSGGSAKGLAHIGVIQALEELGVGVDVVTGTSMGGLVGGLYASGYDAREIQRIAGEQDWTDLFTDAPERQFLTPDRRADAARTVFAVPLRGGGLTLPGGVVSGQNIMRLIQRLTWPVQTVHDFRRLPIPFAAVATDLETGDAVVLDSGVLAEAMRATIALPGGIAPYRLNGRLLADGGISRNLPAEDARALGADFLICSDVTRPRGRAERLQSIFDILNQTITLEVEKNTEPQRRLCDVLIRPEQDGLTGFDFGATDEWVRRGIEATQLHAETLQRIAGPRGARFTARTPFLPDSLVATRIEVRGVLDPAKRIVERAIDLPSPTVVDAQKLDAALARLYATDLFAQAIYRVETEAGDTTVVFDIREGANDQIGLGIRFDDHRKAALLFSGTLHNRLSYGSTMQLDLRLGEELQARARFLPGLGIRSPVSLGAEARHTRAVFDVFDNDRQVAEIRARVSEAAGLLASPIGRTTAAGLRLGIEYLNAHTSIAPEDTAQDEFSLTAAGELWRNTLNRNTYPTRGVALHVQSLWAERIGEGEFWTQHIFNLERVFPVARRTAVRAQVYLGAATGDEVPIHRLFFLGGAYPTAIFGESQPAFWGLRPQERFGKAAQVFRVSVQQRIRGRIHAIAGLNAGNTLAEWSWPDGYLVGWGVAVGSSTAIGPIELTLHGRGPDNKLLLDLNIGYVF